MLTVFQFSIPHQSQTCSLQSTASWIKICIFSTPHLNEKHDYLTHSLHVWMWYAKSVGKGHSALKIQSIFLQSWPVLYLISLFLIFPRGWLCHLNEEHGSSPCWYGPDVLCWDGPGLGISAQLWNSPQGFETRQVCALMKYFFFVFTQYKSFLRSIKLFSFKAVLHILKYSHNVSKWVILKYIW